MDLIRENKTKAVNGQKYEEAAKLRDEEKKLEEKLEDALECKPQDKIVWLKETTIVHSEDDSQRTSVLG
mgnify:CR=1 FL=1